MDDVRKRAEEALAAIDAAIGDADETTPERVSLAALGPALCDLIRATRALLAAEPAKAPFVSRNEEWGLRPDFTTAGVPAPPDGAEVREAAEALLDDYAGVEDMLLPDTLEKVLRLRAALRSDGR